MLPYGNAMIINRDDFPFPFTLFPFLLLYLLCRQCDPATLIISSYIDKVLGILDDTIDSNSLMLSFCCFVVVGWCTLHDLYTLRSTSFLLP